MLMHNATMPWPKSYDGQKAVRCDKQGTPTTKGQFITWESVLPGEFDPSRMIAKLFRPEKKTEPLDYATAKIAVASEPRYNLRLPKTRVWMQARLVSVMGRLGINYLDALNLTHITPDIDTACWGTGPKEEDEFILINPYFVANKRSFLSFIIQHEAMHRALYRGRKHLADKQLLNVVLDICINRILASSYSGKPSKVWHRFCEWIYPEESKRGILALCNASLTANDLRMLRRVNPTYAKIWEELYGLEKGIVKGQDPQGRTRYKATPNALSRSIKDFNPDDLYFRLKPQLTDSDRMSLQTLSAKNGLNPFAQSMTEVTLKKGNKKVVLRVDANDVAAKATKRIEDALRKNLVPKRFRTFNWKNYSDCRTEFWDKYVLGPEDLYDDDLTKYAKRINTDKVLENITGQINKAFQDEVVTQPYPNILSEEGTLLAVIGIRPPRFPFFYNLEGTNGKRRVIVFFDLSPSMETYFAYMARMVDTFENCMDLAFARNNEGEGGVFTFAGSVRPLTTDEVSDMKKGTVLTGQSTSFNELVEYCVDKINTEDVDAVITFTDGESGLTQRNIDLFNDTQKRMFRIYFLEDTKANHGRTVTSDLDKLTGSSFTLCCPKTDLYN